MPPWKGEEILGLKMGKEHFCFAVTDEAGNHLHELAYYTADEIDEIFLSRLLVLHPELNQHFDKVMVSYDYGQNVLIPAQYFKQENSSSLLNGLHGVGIGNSIISDFVSDNGLHSIYSVPKPVHDWILLKYPFAIFSHACKHDIKNIPKGISSGYIEADFNADSVNVMVSSEEQLLLWQKYSYVTPDDVIYYLLKACQQFSLLPSEVKLTLSGLIDKQSNLFHELYQYFINIDFKNADWIIGNNNEYPLHFFASLNEIIRCEL